MRDKHPGIGAMILAGGKNRRMEGRKKLFLEYEGETFLDILKKRLSSMSQIYLSVETEQPYQSTGLALVADRYPETGPMGGIASVLSVCKEEAVFVAACDMPFIEEETIDRICRAYERDPGKITIAECGDKIHPLCGVYPRAALPLFEERIGRGDYKMMDLVRAFGVNIISFPEDDPSFQNINTLSDYIELRGSHMLQLEEAIHVLTEAVRPCSQTEVIPLADAPGRVLAEDIAAPMDQPPFDRSPLDGYAVRSADTAGASKERPVTLKVVGKIYAGQAFEGEVGDSECLRLMTGAPIPHGADAVIRQENTDYGEDSVLIYEELSPWQNYCYTGEDYHKGDLLVGRGTVLSGIHIGVIAGTGREEVTVFREPGITVISTGDEVVAPGSVLKPGKIYDSNRYLVAGRLRDLGVKKIRSEHCEDDVEEMCQKIRKAAEASQLIITTGGVSVGEKDIMHQVLDQVGGKKLFWRVDLKPGAPTLAFLAGQVPVICLTGNPYGAAVNFELLVRPVLARLTGNENMSNKGQSAILDNDSPKRGGVRRFMRGFYVEDTVRILEGSHASGTLATMVSCNCLVEIPEKGSGKKGEKVWIYPL